MMPPPMTSASKNLFVWTIIDLSLLNICQGIYTANLTKEFNQITLVIEIIINGETKTVQEDITALQLLIDMGIAEKKLALEVNQEVLPRSMLSEYFLQAGDTIEIIHAIGGG